MNFKKFFIIFLFFLLATIIFTYPLSFGLSTYVPAFEETTETYAPLWHFWLMKHSFVNGISTIQTPFVAYPFGMDIQTTSYPTWMFFTKVSAILSNHAFAYNIQILLSFLLSGIFAYFLAYFLTKNIWGSILAGILYTFCPYHFARSWQHLGLAHIQWLPLYMLSLFYLKNKICLKSVLFSVGALFLVASFDFYYLYFAFILAGLFSVFCMLYQWKKKIRTPLILKKDFKIIGAIFISGLITAALLSPVLWSIAKERVEFATQKESGFNSFRRPFEDLFSQSARPLSYILPSTEHPFFGRFTQNFVGSPLWGLSETEHQIYLGWIAMILAIVAFQHWRKKRKARNKDFLESPDDFYIGLFVFMTIAFWFLSQPPWWKIGPLKICMPSFFLYKIFPMFRAYCRFGILVMLTIAVLAGYGLKFILERIRSSKIKIVIACFFCVLAVFEFWNWPPFKVMDVSRAPQAYYWIKKQPENFAIAEYPFDAGGPNEKYKFYQIFHQKPIINGTIPGTHPNKVAQTLITLSSPKTAIALKGMGVKYVVVHCDRYIHSGLVEDRQEFARISDNPGLKFIKSFDAQICPDKNIRCTAESGPIDIYEVIAKPHEPITLERIVK